MSKQGPIVIVEDDLDDQYMYIYTLKKLAVKNEILFFSDGAAAYHYLNITETNPFIILSDINMPIMDGMKFRQKIWSNEILRKKRIPFIFISTSAREEEVRQGNELCVQGYFKKDLALNFKTNLLHMIVEYWRNCSQLDDVLA